MNPTKPRFDRLSEHPPCAPGLHHVALSLSKGRSVARGRSSHGHPGHVSGGLSYTFGLRSPLPSEKVGQWRLFRPIPAQVLEKVANGRLFPTSEMTRRSSEHLYDLSLHLCALSLSKGQL